MKPIKPFTVASLATVLFLMTTSSANAQFDFGRAIENRAQEAIQQLEQRLLSEIQNGTNPVQILPYEPDLPQTYPAELQPYVPNWPQPISPGPIGTLPNPQFPQNIQPGNSIPAQHYYPQQQYAPTNPQNSRSSVPQNSMPQVNVSTTKPATVAKKKLPKVEAAGIVNMSTKKYGDGAGKVYLKIGQLVLNVEILNWTANRVQAKLPYLPMQNSAEAVVLVLSAEKRLLDKAEIQLTPSSNPQTSATATAAPKPKIPMVEPGQRLNIKGEFGESKGSVELRLSGMTLPATMIDWNSGKVNFELPRIALSEAQSGQVVVLKADGSEARTVKVKLAAGAK